jgi:hypothetical protein
MDGHNVAEDSRTRDALVAHAVPLPTLDDPEAFGARFDRFAEARVVLLGEATHGTSEFYRARAAITRRLIERHGFTVVAVEADWPMPQRSTAASATVPVRRRPATHSHASVPEAVRAHLSSYNTRARVHRLAEAVKRFLQEQGR